MEKEKCLTAIYPYITGDERDTIGHVAEHVSYANLSNPTYFRRFQPRRLSLARLKPEKSPL